MTTRLESAIGMVNENHKGLRENQNTLIENLKGLIETQNTLIAMQQRLDAVVQDNTKDVKKLKKQTELIHANLVDQIHSIRDLLQSKSDTTEIAKQEIHTRIDCQERAINNLSLDTLIGLNDLDQ